jgi:hypothetical protein
MIGGCTPTSEDRTQTVGGYTLTIDDYTLKIG